MGGFGSGRHPKGPVVEDGITLDINQLIKHRSFRPGWHVGGTLTWSNTSRQLVASIGYEANLLHPQMASARLCYTINSVPKDYRVWLEATPCSFGGRRWWWTCPLSGRRAVKLHLPPGTTVFAHRSAYRLTHQSQRDEPIQRSHTRQRRLYRRLGATYDHYGQLPPPRPKGMHRATYERILAELDVAMETHEEIFTQGASALIGRMLKLR